MSRTTMFDLKEACQYLTDLTGFEHEVAPKGSGFWELFYKKPTGNGEFEYVGVTNKRKKDMLLFMEAYRRGYGRCLEDQKHGVKLRVNTGHVTFDHPCTTLHVPVKLTGKSKWIDENQRKERQPMEQEKNHVEIEVCGETCFVSAYNLDKPQ